MGETIISIQNLSKSFGEHEVLRKIDIDVKTGEIICIVGSSGSGKSTLLRCINKLEHQTLGKIMYHGKEVRDVWRDVNEYRSKVGMVFQSFNLFNNMTVLENCMLCTRKVLHLSKEEAFDRAITHLKAVGMAPYIHAKPAQLSGGQKQRVAIARALAADPEVLLCDEATSALDPITTRSILALLKKINETMGVTIVIITHEMRVVEQICHRVAVMSEGAVQESGEVREVFLNPKSATARKLILPDKDVAGSDQGRQCIRIAFDGQSSFEPIISTMVLESNTKVTILGANTENIGGKAYGQMIIELPKEQEKQELVRQFLRKNKIHFEEGEKAV